MPRKTKKTEVQSSNTTPRDPMQRRFALRKLVKLFYDFQRLRIQAMGRALSSKTEEEAEIQEELGIAHKDSRTVIQLHPDDVARLAFHGDNLSGLEKQVLRDIQALLDEDPFYMAVLSDKERFRGIGPTMAGVILSSFDIENEDTVSKMWAFAGLRPLPCARCKQCHATLSSKEGDTVFQHPKINGSKCVLNGQLLDAGLTYNSAKAQRPVKGEKLNYNAWLRTKLVGVLGPVLLKCNSPYRKFYDDYKHRKQSAEWGMSDGHRHNAAIRYMIKMLLLDIHTEWRTHLKLPVRVPYAQEYLGKVHHG